MIFTKLLKIYFSSGSREMFIWLSDFLNPGSARAKDKCFRIYVSKQEEQNKLFQLLFSFNHAIM